MPLKSSPKWLSLLKDYWGIGLAVAGALILWGSLPERVKKVEAGQTSQQEDIVDLKGVAGKLEGYIAAQQQMNQQLIQQQPSNGLLRQNIPWKEEGWCCNQDDYEDCWIEDSVGRNQWRRCE